MRAEGEGERWTRNEKAEKVRVRGGGSTRGAESEHRRRGR